MHSSFISASVLLSVVVAYANAHAALVTVTGANGVTKDGLGVTKTTGLSQADAIKVSAADVCGPTVGTNIASALTAASGATAGADGSVTMSLFQINADGAGPYTCGVSVDGTGSSFAAMTVTTQVGNKQGTAQALVATLPAGTTCTSCLVQCENSSKFGGCVAVSTGAAAATTNTTTTAVTGAAAGNTTTTTTGKGAAKGGKHHKGNRAAKNTRLHRSRKQKNTRTSNHVEDCDEA